MDASAFRVFVMTLTSKFSDMGQGCSGKIYSPKLTMVIVGITIKRGVAQKKGAAGVLAA